MLAIALVLLVANAVAAAEEDAALVERRLADDVRYLTSEELEGRELGSRGLELAGQYIAQRLAAEGLKTDHFAGTPYQRLPVATRAELGPENRLTLLRPATASGESERVELSLGEDYTPLASSHSGAVELPLVFAGYGIAAPERGYDDYAHLDVTGKAVVILRHAPSSASSQVTPDAGAAWRNGSFQQKILTAQEHGAAAVIFCTDADELRRGLRVAVERWQQALDQLAEAHAEFKVVGSPTLDQLEAERAKIEKLTQQVQSTSDELRKLQDPLLPFQGTEAGGAVSEIPAFHMRRAVLDRLLRSTGGASLAAVEQQIGAGPTPQSRSLAPWRLIGQADVQRTESEACNVLGTLEPQDPQAQEAILIGAHYDHLGRGGRSSLAPTRHEIHPGADDNASGVAVLLEVAHQLAAQRASLGRRVIFVAFTGEEPGVLGSSYYVRHPLVPLNQTVAMVNLDMVGRLRENRLLVGGAYTSTGFASLLEQANMRGGFELTPKTSGFGPSDQIVFYPHHIPVLHFYTGTHETYHRPEDKLETLNLSGMRRIASLVSEFVLALANQEARPDWLPEAR